MREVVTLQLGQRSNYLATQFWNLQESYFTYDEAAEPLVDHDVHFRSGIGADGTETYTPRTVIYDLKGGFGTLRQYNALYDIDEPADARDGLWTGKQVVEKQPRIAPSEYQQSLEAALPAPRLTAQSVRYWSDFNRVFYHPRSIVHLHEYQLGSQIAPFDTWTAGEELYQTIDREDDIIDRDFRAFAEECDSLQGIQVFAGIDDAWGGFAARYVDALKDEFGKTCVWVWGSQDNAVHDVRKKTLLSVNKARSMAEIAPHVSAYIPLALDAKRLPSYSRLEIASEWYSSALLAPAVESVTLPNRLKNSQAMTADNWLSGTDGDHTIFELECSVSPDGAEMTDALEHNLDAFDSMDSCEQDAILLGDLDMHLTPIVAQGDSHVFAQSRVNRKSAETPSSAKGSTPPSHISRVLESGALLQREALANGLGDLADRYKHHWDDSDESDSD
ncbi:mtDNA inheritance, partitioning of the mitochondrial organelle [Ascosphaera acerosa]|nr:mtDNA inheritance, partitioning of the mitochondrial organelle [Ascosphaera acerosa]